jgi:PAS domain S-box-containing protein
MLEAWDCGGGDLLPEAFRGQVVGTLDQGCARKIEIMCVDRMYSIVCAPVEAAGYVNIYGRDITARKRAEDALRKSEARFRQMAENIREVFLLGSPDWNEVLYVSPAYEGIWGRSHQSLYEQPRSWLDAVAEEDRDRVIADLNRRAAGDPAEPRFPEFRVVRPDGSVRWVSARMFPIQNERGEVYRIAGICEDITERKRGEQMARQHEAELAHAWRISAMGEMTAGLAHELNQPLFSIMAYAEACRIRMQSGRANPDEVVQDLCRITAAAERAGSIIRRLKNFIRKREPKRSTFDVNTLIAEVMPFVEAQARERKVRVRLKAGSDMPTALGDSILVQQVILNLARNAIEAMEGVRAEDRRLIIQARRAGRDEVEVVVRDNGSGMSDELMHRLFEPFFTTKPAGLGLGLSISHSIIEANGGHLAAERNADRGMTFRFTLPVSKGGPNHGV